MDNPTHTMRCEEATWQRFRIAAVTARKTTGGFLEQLMDVYDRWMRENGE